MKSAVIRANAKINLTLDICGKRPDGYHLIETIMQSIDLSDEVSICRNSSGSISLICDDPALPQGAGNLAYRAAEYFFAGTGIRNPGIEISIKKRIPAQAGLAGGSADAAAVIAGLNVLLGAGLGKEELAAIGLKAGADLPFCLAGGTMLARGIGELLTPLPALPDCTVVVARPKRGVSTAAAYAAYDRLYTNRRAAPRPRPQPDNRQMAAALKTGDLAAVGRLLCNVLEEAAGLDEIGRIKAHMSAFGALGAAMTGSGSAVFGLFESAERAQACAAATGHFAAFVCRPARRGWIMV